jgi:aconitate hydratase
MSTSQRTVDPFHARDTLQTPAGPVGIYRITRLEDAGLTRISRLPYSIRVLLESVLRSCDGYEVTEEDVKRLAGWNPRAIAKGEIPFKPARVVLQDFTGVPAVVDLAAMRSAMKRLGGDPKRINPLIPVDLVIDHSVQVDRFGSAGALAENVELEMARNRERYEFLRWGQQALANFRVVPPAVGIVHQVNLEYLAKCVFLQRDAFGPVAVPDTLVGTDSHTTMINGLGVLGWGVGGIEAEAVMLGQPLYMLLPEVIGFELTGRLAPGATATDLVLTITQILRREGVVEKFVEYFGPGVSGMTVADRATLANMSPEYGATIGFFPIDVQTLDYLLLTGRTEDEVQLVERYAKQQEMFRTESAPPPEFTKILSLDLGTVEPSMAGPKRPQDRVPLRSAKEAFRRALQGPIPQRGFALGADELGRRAQVGNGGPASTIGHGAVVIAAITSCTNTSNPSVMLAAGLVAQKAVQRGLRVPPHVKTSLSPGSRVVTDYLAAAGLDKPLAELGFDTVGYGCMTCIGNSGPLPEPVAKAVTENNLVAAAVLSGNRNFEGRINALVKANYLASPPLVVAYALAGTMDVDLTTEPLGTGRDGRAVFLADIWPTREEVEAAVGRAVRPEMFRQRYRDVLSLNPKWNAIPVAAGELFSWDPASTYVQEPPFLLDLTPEPGPVRPILGARVLLALGDSVTTDHISPAGSIAQTSPAGRYLIEHGVAPADFNSYGSRRGNDRVMTRGTFANIRLRNLLAPGTEGGVTRHFPDGKQMTVYEASLAYRAEGVPLVVLAGAEYGSGSSRDWAAKGTYLLGIRAVLAASFERIHRSNLVGMGVLPLEFCDGRTWQSLGLSGEEVFDFPALDDRLQPRQELTVRAAGPGGQAIEFQARVRIDTPVELEYYRNGGILQTVLRKLLMRP